MSKKRLHDCDEPCCLKHMDCNVCGLNGEYKPFRPKDIHECAECNISHTCMMFEQNMDEYFSEVSVRTKNILVIKAREALDPTEEGVELNGGYEYDMNGAIPEIADGIAKMAIEMDGMKEFGENAGEYFLHLISEYYAWLKSK